MKNIKLKYNFVLLLVLLVGVSACEKKEIVPTLAEEQAEVTNFLKSADSWGASEITRESQDATSLFPDFSLSFGEGSYTAVNGRHVWPDSGTWTFVEGKSDQIIRDDGIAILLEMDNEKLTLSFELDEEVYSTGGREESLISRFIFNLFKR